MEAKLLTIFIDVSDHMVWFFTAQYCDKLSKKKNVRGCEVKNRWNGSYPDKAVLFFEYLPNLETC